MRQDLNENILPFIFMNSLNNFFLNLFFKFAGFNLQAAYNSSLRKLLVLMR